SKRGTPRCAAVVIRPGNRANVPSGQPRWPARGGGAGGTVWGGAAPPAPACLGLEESSARRPTAGGGRAGTYRRPAAGDSSGETDHARPVDATVPVPRLHKGCSGERALGEHRRSRSRGQWLFSVDCAGPGNGAGFDRDDPAAEGE